MAIDIVNRVSSLSYSEYRALVGALSFVREGQKERDKLVDELGDAIAQMAGRQRKIDVAPHTAYVAQIAADGNDGSARMEV